jgi:hypothetical protein
MAVLPWLNKRMADIVKEIQVLLPHIRLEAGDTFFWSPESLTITYNPSHISEESGVWALLHESAHALLRHSHYDSDFELLSLEVQAWQKAKEIAAGLSIAISEEHIQDCLDTYRDWLHQRSTCPTCGTVSIQENQRQYRCHNCNGIWQVTASRFCRPYRIRASGSNKKSPEPVTTQTTFQ